MEDAAMIRRLCSGRPSVMNHLAAVAVAVALVVPLIGPAPAAAQGAAQTGSVGGKVVDDKGAPVAGAQVAIPGTTAGAQTGTGGDYVIAQAPVGTHTIRVR